MTGENSPETTSYLQCSIHALGLDSHQADEKVSYRSQLRCLATEINRLIRT